MALRPRSRDELASALQDATRRRTPPGPIDLSALNRVIRHAPEDLTITVESGLTLGELQSALARHGQWLPVDPPGARDLPIADLLDHDLSGPRRFGHGTLREHLIGLRAVLADGRIIRSGGEVVKNVAGYDLLKLFVGARRSLGVIVEASFKLLPLPAAEAFTSIDCATWEEASLRLDAVLSSPLTPIVLDLHSPPPASAPSVPSSAASPVARLTLGFAGAREAVDWQLALARELGFTAADTLDYAEQFAETRPAAAPETRAVSVLPSRLVETLQAIAPAAFVARAGNGRIEFRGGTPPTPAPLPTPAIQRRLKDEFDPLHLLPDAPTP